MIQVVEGQLGPTVRPRSSPRPWGSQEMRVEGGDGTVIHRFQGRDGIKIEIEIKNQGLKRVE